MFLTKNIWLMFNKKTYISVLLMSLLPVSGAMAQQTGYPKVQRYEHNPLFTAFSSPMFESTTIGHLYTADPSAHVWTVNGKERLYVYASHDMEPQKTCSRMNRYHVFSTEDMVKWTDHGEMLNSDDVKQQMGYGVDGFMWAPDAAFNKKDNKYYFIYPHMVKAKQYGDKEDIWRMFVATSDDPATGFVTTDTISGGKIPAYCIDPCIFVDDDGKAYIYVSGRNNCYAGKLKDDDWTKMDGEVKVQEGLPTTNFHEAPYVFKKDGLYYLLHSDHFALGGNRMLYSTSTSPLGPWKQRGVYLYSHGGDTTHGSIVKYKNKWWQFYHTAHFSGNGALRTVCFDEVTFNADGTINPVHNWGTPHGETAPEVSYNKVVTLSATDYNDGGSHTAWYKRPSGSFVEGELNETPLDIRTQDGFKYVAQMKEKEWLRYSLDIKQTGLYQVRLKMRANQNNSKFIIAVDGKWMKCYVPVTTSNGTWGETVVTVPLNADNHYIEWRGGGGSIDVASLSIEKSDLHIPGTIEAEDFDEGGEGKAYHWKQKGDGGDEYRTDCVMVGNHTWNNQNSWHLGWANPNDWTQYTVTVDKDGLYDIAAAFATGQDNKKYQLLIDDVLITGDENIQKKDWHTYVTQTYATDVELKAGKHVLKFTTPTGGINADAFYFTLKKDLTNGIEAVKVNSSSNEESYAINGIKMKKNAKGIHISNGKKYIINK